MPTALVIMRTGMKLAETDLVSRIVIEGVVLQQVVISRLNRGNENLSMVLNLETN